MWTKLHSYLGDHYGALLAPAGKDVLFHAPWGESGGVARWRKVRFF